MPTESLNGIKIFYERQGVGPPIVLVHGSWGDHHNWDAVAPALAREYDVIRYDRRGHSQSGPAPTPGAAEQDVDDLLALVDRLEVRQPVAIGNSFGGTITLKAVARAPEALGAIVIHEPPLTGMVTNLPGVGEQATSMTQHFERNIVPLLEAGKIEEGTRMFVDTVAFGPGAWNTLPQAIKDTFINNALTWPDELRDPGWSVVDLEALRRFDGPALFTTGTASASFFPPIVERIAAAFARARLVTYQGAGHVPHATHPNGFLEVVLPFLREVST